MNMRVNKVSLPAQKCIAGENVKNLADYELLAAIIGTGGKGCDVIDVSTGLIKYFGGVSGIFSAGLREISGIKGIGMMKAVRIQAAIELGRRALSGPVAIRQIDSPRSVWSLLLPELGGLAQEEFRALILNNKNMILKKVLVSVGTISEAIVHPREVFREAIREGGCSVVIAHNHPSGICTPSMEDIRATERIHEAGKIIGIQLLDHVIVTNTTYLSMKEEGYLQS